MAAASLGGKVLRKGNEGLRLGAIKLRRALGKCWRSSVDVLKVMLRDTLEEGYGFL